MSSIKNTNIIKRDLYAKYLESEIEYFESIRKPEILIKGITDKVNVESNTLTGISFPLCIVLESLGALSSVYSSKKISLLEELLTTRLYENFKNYGFNYFSEGYIPLDLDTVSSMTRILGERYPDVLNDYNDIIDRNLQNNRLVPTWLDTDKHEHWCSGNGIFHIDVMLNFWLTEVKYKSDLDVELIKNTVNSLGLKNYWYIPSLYTPYLYLKLLNKLKLLNEDTYLEPLTKIIVDYSNDPQNFRLKSNSTNINTVQSLIKQNKCEKLENILYSTILENLPNNIKYKDFRIKPSKMIEILLSNSIKNEALYWSLRFQLYRSSIATRSVLIDCIITTLNNIE